MVKSILSVFFAKDWFVLHSDLVIVSEGWTSMEIFDLCANTFCSEKAHVLRCPSTDHGDMGVLRASWRMWMQAKRRQVNLQHVYLKNKNNNNWFATIKTKSIYCWSITGDENDCQMDGITKLAPVVAFYAGKPEMLEKVEAAVRVTQNNDACVAETLAAARQAGLPINSQPHACDTFLMGIMQQHKSLLGFRKA